MCKDRLSATGSTSVRAISTHKILAACVMFLFLAHLPAYADHLHHLWYNNSNWQDQDLTSLTGAPPSVPFGAIVAFHTTPNNQLHLYYVDFNVNHVHQMFYNGSTWSDQDLSSLVNGPAAQPYGIAGFAIGNLQYVFYESSPDGHVHEIYYNNSIWQDQDLTAAVNGPTSISPMLAFPTKPNNQFHVYYQDNNNDLHQLYFNGSSWSDSDLTSVIGHGVSCYADWFAGFAVQNLQHVFCAGHSGSSNQLDLLHIHYNNATWVYEDVTTAGLGMYLGAGVAAFKVPNANQLEVWSVTGNNHFDRFTHVIKPAQWVFNDLSNEIGAPTDAQFGQIVSFVTTPNNQYHVYYAPSTEVYQIYYNGTTWSVDDLTGGAGNADSNSGMSGFSIGNLQHVFYMSNN